MSTAAEEVPSCNKIYGCSTIASLVPPPEDVPGKNHVILSSLQSVIQYEIVS